MEYYKEKIQSNTDWILVGVFFDCESGLRIEKRNGLKKILELMRLGQNAHYSQIERNRC